MIMIIAWIFYCTAISNYCRQTKKCHECTKIYIIPVKINILFELRDMSNYAIEHRYGVCHFMRRKA